MLIELLHTNVMHLIARVSTVPVIVQERATLTSFKTKTPMIGSLAAHLVSTPSKTSTSRLTTSKAMAFSQATLSRSLKKIALSCLIQETTRTHAVPTSMR